MNPITNTEPMSKERPILFSGPMVRAILEGRKTQTRRIVKPQPVVRYGGHITEGYYAEGGAVFKEGGEGGHRPMRWCEDAGFVPSRLGKPGDRLWVRETHLIRGAGTVVDYRADMDPVDAAGHGAFYGGWKPSLFMRREHSRITLEVTGVRVERLQDISEEDAKAEGCGLASALNDCKDVEECGRSFRAGYAKLWEDINGIGSWEANPWVWVIKFKHIEP